MGCFDTGTSHPNENEAIPPRREFRQWYGTGFQVNLQGNIRPSRPGTLSICDNRLLSLDRFSVIQQRKSLSPDRAFGFGGSISGTLKTDCGHPPLEFLHPPPIYR